MKTLIRYLILFVILISLGTAAWTWASLTYVYSTGERAGYVQKFSRKGWVFKTWEGEIAMVNLPGTMQERFSFSVRKPEVAEQIRKTLGRRVVIDYEQHRFVPSRIFGETEYFAVAIREVEDEPMKSLERAGEAAR